MCVAGLLYAVPYLSPHKALRRHVERALLFIPGVFA